MTERIGTTDGSGAESLRRAMTALTQAQQRVLSNDARYRAIIENAVDAIITIDEDGIIESVNPSALRMFEYSEAELVGQNVSILAPSPDREQHDEYIRRYLKTGQARIIGIGRQVEGVKRSGARFPMRLSIGQSALDGRQFFTGIIQDLTERKRYDESVRLNSAIVESSSDAIIGLTPDGVLSSWNGGAERLCGYCADEMIGEPITRIIPHDHREAFAGCRERVRLGESVSGVEMTWQRKDGAEVCVDLNMSPIRGEANSVVGASIAAHDTTDQKRAELALQEHAERMEVLNEELQRRRDETESQRRELAEINGRLMMAMRDAQAAAEAKTQFVANMSHEIRTPLTAILGYVSVLGERLSTPDVETAEALDVIRRNGSRLLVIIDDILDFSKLDSGRLEVQRSRFDPVDVVRDVMAPMETRAANKGLTLRLDGASSIPKTIESDVTRFRQVLDNLIDNALKFTEVGGVTVSLGVREDTPEPLLEVRVVDTGIGIDPSRAGELFEPFSQADSSMTRPFGGTGLGLSVCARLVKLLGGELSVSGAPGRGSEFRFTIAAGTPASVKEAEAEGAASTPQAGLRSDEQRLDGRRVLLVEDGVDNQRLYRHFLTKAGADVDVAVNGSDAVALMLNGRDSNRVPEIILMDMQMPVMDGYEATRSLRASNFATPIIALTAHAMTYDRSRCLDAGCDDYLSKPVDRKTLVGTVRQWLERTEESRAAAVMSKRGGYVPSGPSTHD